MNSYGSRTGGIPLVVLNLLIINTLLFLATIILQQSGTDLTSWLGLYYPGSVHFKPYQLITHMFMHGGWMHLFFNMFALWMFGRVLEQVWGGRRFLIYFFVTGLGAAGLHLLVQWLRINSLQHEVTALINTPAPEIFAQFVKSHFPQYQSQISGFLSGWASDPSNPSYINQAIQYAQQLVKLRVDVPTIGASGAVFGVLLAFGMLFPNTRLMLLFPPIPIKAKWFVLGYGLIELYSGVINQSGDNIAHFAHLGGMLFGFVLIKFWNKTQRNRFY
ncbi:MAG: rhomboid family intramembrane serine protease [Bacteroidales bacterium]|nr:rhomboid family intramembrane serine protease [Bacteroidales bacterium]